MFGTQIWTHVDLHQIDFQIGIQDKVKTNHFEKCSFVWIIGQSFLEFRLFVGINVPYDVINCPPHFFKGLRTLHCTDMCVECLLESVFQVGIHL